MTWSEGLGGGEVWIIHIVQGWGSYTLCYLHAGSTESHSLAHLEQSCHQQDLVQKMPLSGD